MTFPEAMYLLLTIAFAFWSYSSTRGPGTSRASDESVQKAVDRIAKAIREKNL